MLVSTSMILKITNIIVILKYHASWYNNYVIVMKKILIVEDDFTIQRELLSLLKNAGYNPVVLESYEHALEEIAEVNPDLILLDICIPHLNGQILLSEIRKSSNVPIIMVTSKDNEVDEVLAMSYGADDYITKPYNPTLLLLHIGAVFKRLEASYNVAQYAGLTINFSKGIITKDDKEVYLTKNEMIIFSYLFSNKNKLVSRDELMTELWNNDEYINDNALTVNISRLRSKLKELGSDNLITTRKGQGYILS